MFCDVVARFTDFGSRPNSALTTTTTTTDDDDEPMPLPPTSRTPRSLSTTPSAAPAISSAITSGTRTTATAGFKGKALRSWPQLPPEVIRLIATYHLHAAAAATPLPASWDHPTPPSAHTHSTHESEGEGGHDNTRQDSRPDSRQDDRADNDNARQDNARQDSRQDSRQDNRQDNRPRTTVQDNNALGRAVPWDQRLVYVAARDAREMEVFMSVCPAWGGAVEMHAFWKSAIKLLDPFNQCGNFAWMTPLQPPSQHSSAAAPQPVPATPYHHFRQILNYACLPCRINAPRSTHGLNSGRRTVGSARLGTVVLCKEHHGARRARWCGVCLKDGDIARMVRADVLRHAQDALQHAEYALKQARWDAERGRAGPGSVDRAYEAREAAAAALGRAQRAEELGDAGVADNEDEGTFAHVHATCRACRAEWLWRGALGAAANASAAGGAGEGGYDRGAELLGALGVSGAGAFAPADAGVRAAVAAFVELGEGTVRHVLVVASERGWLRAQTRWAEMMGQALAARRFNAGDRALSGAARPDYSGVATVRFVKSGERGRRGRSATPESYANNAANVAAYARAGYTNTTTNTTTTTASDYEEEYDDEYDEDDSELDLELEDEEELEDDDELATALEASVRELALGDWARGRILDGAWVAPADVYYNLHVGDLDGPDARVKAVHPVPWAVSPPSSPSPAAAPPDAPTDVHPGPAPPPPPTYALAEAAHTAHVRQLRAVLLPAFRNVVRRLVVECALDAAEGARADPAVRAARMGLGDVVSAVREEEGVWFDGVDWRERRRNARAEAGAVGVEEGDRERDGERERRHRAEGSDDSSEGTPRTSGTSPVLSTSTLGTTPSPPPLGEHHKGTEEQRQPTIAVMPVLDPPRLLRPIPYVPETIAHLPPYSIEALRTVWREACAPLYHCRCSICERAMAVAQAAQGGDPAATAPKPAAVVIPAAKPHSADAPFVVHLPAEDDAGGRGADSVVSLRDGDGDGDGDADEEELLSPRSLYFRQLEEQEGEGAAEREMELIDDMEAGRLRALDEEEEELYSESEEFEEEEGAGAAYALAPGAWVAGRKRSVDELEREAGAEGEGGRARTGEREYGVRLLKRSSEELDADGTDADTDTASAGSARSKRARLEGAESPPDTNTPGTVGSGEESAYETGAPTALRVSVDDAM
ncbi:hypothetical protein B0H17DRAFT_1206701 [Mycena rosella]|uniref:Uncharacterized protein n=1 Tax=Mycena rosella TaxID=1033263 RepID=A0AAD7G8X3_MYCRO|nr:hypothetical protein B0H17DRAFT_1206701 [Mycena rosella]